MPLDARQIKAPFHLFLCTPLGYALWKNGLVFDQVSPEKNVFGDIGEGAKRWRVIQKIEKIHQVLQKVFQHVQVKVTRQVDRAHGPGIVDYLDCINCSHKRHSGLLE